MSRGYVYALRCSFTGRIKFGFTSTEAGVRKRLAHCQTGSPTRLELVGYRPGFKKDERIVHSALDRWRLHGEWFRPHDEVHDAMNLVAGDRVNRLGEAGRDLCVQLRWWSIKSGRGTRTAEFRGDV
jgi:hypothetical protein